MGEQTMACTTDHPIDDDGQLPDFHTICRICARIDSALRPILPNSANRDGDVDMAAYIKKYLHIEVSTHRTQTLITTLLDT